MFKIIEAGSWDRLKSQGIVHVLPVRKSGSISQNDRRDFLCKTAASERFLYEIGEIKLADGDIPVHVSAIGAAEYYGPNRKGDAFSEQVCRDRHRTFVTEGRNYVHHRNRDPNYSFGKIASSCYNEDMHRIELLVVSNGTESAARRNGGHVVPDEFLSQLEKNAEVPVSMGCTIDHDVCNICGNRARTRAEYCDETNCRDPKTDEYFPGCRSGLMKIASNGRMQFVYNIEPTFFDLSYVGVPADRAGYGYRADYLPHRSFKEASLDSPTAEQYLCVRPYGGWTMQYRQEMMSMLGKLAAFERHCQSGRSSDFVSAYGIRAIGQNPVLGAKLADMLPATRIAAIRVLADQGVLLSPENFATAFSFGKTAAVDLQNASDLIYGQTLRHYEQCDQKPLASVLAALDDMACTKLAEMRLPVSFVRENTLSMEKIASAVRTGTLRYGPVFQNKTNSSPLRDSAEAYALCNAASLCRFPAEMQEFGIKLAVWQTGATDRFER